MPLKAERVKWREARGTGWSETIYSGLRVDNGVGFKVLVSKLSHGLRVLPITDVAKYCFEGTPVQVEISDAFREDALDAFAADFKFYTTHTKEYELLMSA